MEIDNAIRVHGWPFEWRGFDDEIDKGTPEPSAG